jgi:hypothetical protein
VTGATGGEWRRCQGCDAENAFRTNFWLATTRDLDDPSGLYFLASGAATTGRSEL